MRLSSDVHAVLEMVDQRLEPGQRVPDAWHDLPLPLRIRLKETLIGSRQVNFELGFAEFVHAYLVMYRRQNGSGDDGARLNRSST